MSPTTDSGREGRAAVVLAVLAVVCCAAPGLIAAGALSAIGSVLGSGWVVAGAAAVALLAVATTVFRRRTRRSTLPGPESGT